MGKQRPTQVLWLWAQSPVLIFAIAISMRLWVAWQLLPQKAQQYFYQYNEAARIASALVSGYGYSSPWANTPLLPTAQQPPVYPLMLAVIFRIFGVYSMPSLWTAVSLNALFGALTAIVILALGRRLFSPLVAVLAAWIWSAWLYEAAVSVRLWENALSALWLTSFLLWMPKVATSNRISRWSLFGLLAGFAILTNTTLLVLFPFFWLWIWTICRREGKPCNQKLLISVAACTLVMVPWTIRNYMAFHKLIPVRDNFGLEFWLGNHEGVTHTLDNDFPILNPTEYNRLGEINFMESKRRIGLQFVREHPAQFLQLSFRRFGLFWSAPEGSPWLPVSLLAWLGLFLALRHTGMQAVPFLIVLLFFPLVYYITHTFPTYRHPIEPAMLLLAAYGVAEAGRVFLLRRRIGEAVGAEG